jgi:proline iminopeptidase
VPIADPRTFDDGRLEVGDGHLLAYAQYGSPDGLPILFLHGGPGSGTPPTIVDAVDPVRHRLVLFDQRAAGLSRPHASTPDVDWAVIDMNHHVADIEHLRTHLGVERWVVHGYSWGSVLGLTYTERHPERVRAVVVGAVSTGRRLDIDWLTVQSGRFFPAQWQAFRDHIPERLRHLRLVDAYAELLHDPDPAVHEPAALAWCRWEAAHVAVTADAEPDPRYEDAWFRLGFARQVTHCWRHDSWLTDDELVSNADRLTGIPGWLVHGRLDVSSPLDAPWRLHRAWPGSDLVVVDDEGHGGDGIFATCKRILAEI